MYSSINFADVPDGLQAKVPDKLVHEQVDDTKQKASQQFSQQRRHKVAIADLPSKTISMSLGSLEPGESTNKHRHNYETLIYIISGDGKSIVEDREISWRAGDAIYVPVWAWHQHINTGFELCRYVAAENAPLLLNLGEIAVREES